MRLPRLVSAILLFAVLLTPSAAPAQEASPEPAEEEGCRVGELCGSGTRQDRFQDDNRVDAVDPPGDYARSLISLGLIAAVVGAYLFIALTGRSIFRRKPRRA